MSDTDKAWRRFGSTEPYHSVLTKDVFLEARLDASARDAFFETGENYVSFILDVVRHHVDEHYVPGRTLDFGCGVGRLTIPLASRGGEVIGVDISDRMLSEATINAARAGIENARFVPSDDNLSAVDGAFDLIHSFIVLQHIVPRRGERLIEQLVGRLRDGGVGILHVTYAYATTTPRRRRLVTAMCDHIPGVSMLLNLVSHRPMMQPMMRMSRYNLNRIMRQLQESGCHDVHIRFTDSSPVYGAIIFFKKVTHDLTHHC